MGQQDQELLCLQSQITTLIFSYAVNRDHSYHVWYKIHYHFQNQAHPQARKLGFA